MPRAISRALFARILLLCASCSVLPRSAGTYNWMDAPVGDSEIPLGQTTKLDGHATSSQGLSHAEFWISGDPVRLGSSTSASNTLSHFGYSWQPEAPGTYVVQMLSYGQDGGMSTMDTITIDVFDGGVGPENVPAPIPELASTATPTASPTLAPLTCTPTHTATPAPTLEPTLTPTHTPRPTQPPTPTCTQTPLPPPDTNGPPAPTPVSPEDEAMLECVAKSVVEWSSVADPSGIEGYTLWVQRSAGDEKWQPIPDRPWSSIPSTAYKVAVECGRDCRWRTPAIDGAG